MKDAMGESCSTHGRGEDRRKEKLIRGLVEKLEEVIPRDLGVDRE
jgi:hypothetical protein